MVSKKMKALTAAGRSGWATSAFLSKEREHFCVNSFLFGCPIPSVSSSGKHLSALDLADNSKAAQTLRVIFGDLDPSAFFCNLELRQVAKHLIDIGSDGDRVPKGNSEFLVFSKSPYGVLKDQYSLFPDKEKLELTSSDAQPYGSLLVLDAVYRHLRNSLAHGSFTEVRRKVPNHEKPVPFLYLQDTNRYRQITARYFVSYERLQLMTEQLQKRENNA